MTYYIILYHIICISYIFKSHDLWITAVSAMPRHQSTHCDDGAIKHLNLGFLRLLGLNIATKKKRNIYWTISMFFLVNHWTQCAIFYRSRTQMAKFPVAPSIWNLRQYFLGKVNTTNTNFRWSRLGSRLGSEGINYLFDIFFRRYSSIDDLDGTNVKPLKIPSGYLTVRHGKSPCY